MFTGIIYHLTRVVRVAGGISGAELHVARPEDKRDLISGNSIAINGVCLTARTVTTSEVAFDVIPETLARSTLGSLQAGELVNWEPSLRAGDELGGHLVYGHVDATCEIVRKDPEGHGFRLWCVMPRSLAHLIVEKGYVSLDGVSLTVAQTEADRFAIALIPETLKRTTLGRKSVGLSLNIEVDPVARYVAAQLQAQRRQP